MDKKRTGKLIRIKDDMWQRLKELARPGQSMNGVIQELLDVAEGKVKK